MKEELKGLFDRAANPQQDNKGGAAPNKPLGGVGQAMASKLGSPSATPTPMGAGLNSRVGQTPVSTPSAPVGAGLNSRVGQAPVNTPSAPVSAARPQAPAQSVPSGLAAGNATRKPEAGMKGVLIKDATLKYDSYGSARPDGKPTQTLRTGTAVEINNVVANPKPGQTHTIHVNGIGWIQADAVKV